MVTTVTNDCFGKFKSGSLPQCTNCQVTKSCHRTYIKATQINHLKCKICGKAITYFNEGVIKSYPHFNISRVFKTFVLENKNLTEIDTDIKFNITICKDCFIKIIQESRKLNKLFLNTEGRVYPYDISLQNKM